MTGFALMFVVTNLAAQEPSNRIPIKNVYGSATGSESETLAEIRQRAMNEAKITALREAGIHENIQAYTSYFQSENNLDYQELFASNIFTDIRGAVTGVEVVRTHKAFTPEDHLQVEVWIDCTVLRYDTRRDLSFVFDAGGVKKIYHHQDPLSFRVRPHKNGYLRAFVFTGEEAFQVFPNAHESSFLLQAGEEYHFPRNSRLILETEKPQEPHRMALVFLKEDIPYSGESSYQSILDWIFTIPPDQRSVKPFAFTVVKE